MKLIFSYLTNRWRRAKINTTISSLKELIQGVPQGFAIGPLLFNIYLNDLFYLSECTDVCNFADYTTFYLCVKELRALINKFEHDTPLAIECFENNHMKLRDRL